MFSAIVPVSYTHLDVYKRHLYTFARNVAYSKIRIPGVIKAEKNIPLSLKNNFLFRLISANTAFILSLIHIWQAADDE